MTIFDHIKADIEEAMRTELITPALVNRGYGWIQQLKAESPLIHALVMAVVYGEPAQVLKALGKWEPGFADLHRSPIALKYVGLLQERLRAS